MSNDKIIIAYGVVVSLDFLLEYHKRYFGPIESNWTKQIEQSFNRIIELQLDQITTKKFIIRYSSYSTFNVSKLTEFKLDKFLIPRFDIHMRILRIVHMYHYDENKMTDEEIKKFHQEIEDISSDKEPEIVLYKPMNKNHF